MDASEEAHPVDPESGGDDASKGAHEDVVGKLQSPPNDKDAIGARPPRATESYIHQIPHYDSLSQSYAGPWGAKVFWFAVFTIAPLFVGLKSPWRLETAPATLIYAVYHVLGIYVYLEFSSIRSPAVLRTRVEAERAIRRLHGIHKFVRPIGWVVVLLVAVTFLSKVAIVMGSHSVSIERYIPVIVQEFLGIPPPEKNISDAVQAYRRERDRLLQFTIRNGSPQGNQGEVVRQETAENLRTEADECGNEDTDNCRLVRASYAVVSGDADSALQELPDSYVEDRQTAALELAENVWHARQIRADSYWIRGDWTRVIAELEAAQALGTDELGLTWKRLAAAHANRGSELVASGRENDAVLHFRSVWSALATNPGEGIRLLDFHADKNGVPANWISHVKFGHDQARVMESPSGKTAVRLPCRNASYKRLQVVAVDLHSTPWLRWSWAVYHHPEHSTLAQVSTDGEQAAQVLVGFLIDDALARAIHYAWFSEGEKGSRVSYSEDYSATGASLVIDAPQIATTVGPGMAHADSWVEVSVNVLEDYRAIYNEEPPVVNLVAVQANCQHGKSHSDAAVSQLLFTSE